MFEVTGPDVLQHPDAGALFQLVPVFKDGVFGLGLVELVVEIGQ